MISKSILPPINTPFATIHSNQSPRMNQSLPKKHITFKTPLLNRQQNNSASILVQSDSQQEQTKFIQSVVDLITQIHLNPDYTTVLFNEYKNNYINRLTKLNYSKSFIENEVNSAIVIIMRKLYFQQFKDNLTDCSWIN